MKQVRWGILGPGTIAHAFAKGLQEADSGVLAAVASRNHENAKSFGATYGVDEAACYEGYTALCDDPDIDAIYVSTPHPFHKEHGLMALNGGKHLVLEKPAALSPFDVSEIVDEAAKRGLFFMEAYMYLHHPQIREALRILKDDGLGEVLHIRATFCFDAPYDATSRLFDPKLGGGGVYDVGGYTVSAARLFADPGSESFPVPASINASGLPTLSGVDAFAMAQLTFENSVTAELTCAVSRDLGQRVEVFCQNGMLILPTPWLPGNKAAPSDTVIEVICKGEARSHKVEASKMLYAYEAEAASRAIIDGKTGLSYPILSGANSVEMAHILDDWRCQVLR